MEAKELVTFVLYSNPQIFQSITKIHVDGKIFT